MSTPSVVQEPLSSPSSSPASALVFFSIPELTAQVAPYLRKRALGQLRLVSRTLYRAFPMSFDLTLSPLKPALNSTVEWSLITGNHHIIRSLAMDLDGFQSDPRQKQFLQAIFDNFTSQRVSSWSGLERLHITYWGGEEQNVFEKFETIYTEGEKPHRLQVLEEVLVALCTVKELSVAFTATGCLARWFFRLLIRMCSQQPRIQNLSETGCGFNQGSPLSQLRSLGIESRVGSSSKESAVWSDFLDTLRLLPSLNDVRFTNVSFIQPTTVAEPRRLGTGTFDGLTGPFTAMRSLKLADITLSIERLQEFHLLFPSLQELQIVSCTGPFQSALIRRNVEVLPAVPSSSMTTATSASEDAALFPELRKLRIVNKYPGGIGRLVDLVKGRPHLYDLETDISPFSRGDIDDLAEHCSVASINAGQSTPRNRFKRLVIQTDMTTELVQFYGALCFRELESVFFQARQLSERMFPFASTLRSLHLGGATELMRKDEELMLNDILVQLVSLEVFTLDRYLSNYTTFQSLGQDPKTSTRSSSPPIKPPPNQTSQKRRHSFTELSLCLQHPRPQYLLHNSGGRNIDSSSTTPSGSTHESAPSSSSSEQLIFFNPRTAKRAMNYARVNTPRENEFGAFKHKDKNLCLSSLEGQILTRFPSLEKLTVHLHLAVPDPNVTMEEDLRQLAQRHPFVELVIIHGGM
ncbi:hypothetical protein BGZ83_012091 [Gryganskiella cystojenkinii]|nr:hypothetical protein BGZ83_012091 [Gryganskiella cystojenkinii]